MTPACWAWPIPEDLDTTNARTALHIWQAGRCAVCGIKKHLVEDHDHATGLTRGYLCLSCNSLEGVSSRSIFVLYRDRPATKILNLEIRYSHYSQLNHRVVTYRTPAARFNLIKRYAAENNISINTALTIMLDDSFNHWKAETVT